jgi:transmembrane sensor
MSQCDAWSGRGLLVRLRPFLLGLATIVVGAGALALLSDRRPADPPVTYSSQTGEIRSVELADGSLAVLNADSAIRVEYKQDARRVTLERGEATFTVVPDAGRPFLVRVGSGVATTIGARFNMVVRGRDADLVVLEGRVLARRYESKSPEIVVSQGQAVMLGGDGPLQVGPADLTRVDAWHRTR